MKDIQQLVRNRTKAIIGVTLAVVLTSGCSSMLAHVRLSDESARAGGKESRVIEMCGNASLIDKGKVELYLSSVRDYLNYAAYDEAEWEQGRQDARLKYIGGLMSDFTKVCTVYAKNIDGVTARLIQTHQSIATTRSREMAGITRVFQSIDDGLSGAPSYQIPNYQSSQITSPKIEPINTNQSNVTPLYSADDCIGSSVNGMCYGTVLPNAKPTSYCRGIFVNGQCSGAVTDY